MEEKNLIYDYVIVGGGLSGVFLLYKLLKRNSQLRICLIEKNNQLGGRINTIKFQDKSIKNKTVNIQYESGGARFSDLHVNVIKLLKILKLEKDKIKIPSKVKFITYPNNKYDYFLNNENHILRINCISDFINLLKKYKKKYNISDKRFRKYTLYEFTKKFLDLEYNTPIKISTFIINFYEYWSELKVLNAYDALHLFDKEFTSNIQYFILKNGYISLIDGLLKKINNIDKENERHSIYLNSTCKNILKNVNYYKIKTNNQNLNKINILSKNVIFCLQKDLLQKIPFLKNLNNLTVLTKCLKSEPLYRVYARYPIDKKTGKVWFNELGKISTNLPIKFIIPIDYSLGLIMISYTDGKYAKYWHKLYNDDLKNKTKKFLKELNLNLKKLFPNLNIPNPIWLKHHYWKYGAVYWKKNCNSQKLSNDIIQPDKKENIYLAGSDYSLKQVWIEGALESSELLLNKIKLKSKINPN